ncbi:MAG: type II toxin-antitoxin system RelE/ParE family toxin [Alphaproteobacteria bacterium]|nr:type II toxin-antitoxin system RelE/ParE family toxin [Alphaproteobacteria bacterium]OJV45227.1 MAG: addiction module toxin RelE [Alphaproteobacteria bacterium 43-37]
MNVVAIPSFRKIIKKLHPNQKKVLDEAVRKICENPNLGEQKVGDLAEVYVYKFKVSAQLMLLAYKVDIQEATLTLLHLAPHENFYRDLKTKNH